MRAIALKNGNASVAQELLGRGLAISARIVEHYSREWYPATALRDKAGNEVDADFLRTLVAYRVNLPPVAIEALLEDFVKRKADRLGMWLHHHGIESNGAWTYDVSAERNYLNALRGVIASEDLPAIIPLFDQIARKVSAPLCPANQRPELARLVREMFESATCYEYPHEGPAP